MSSSNEERSTAADEIVEPAAATEVVSDEASAGMSAVEALARATDAATDPSDEPATPAEPDERATEPEAADEKPAEQAQASTGHEPEAVTPEAVTPEEAMSEEGAPEAEAQQVEESSVKEETTAAPDATVAAAPESESPAAEAPAEETEPAAAAAEAAPEDGESTAAAPEAAPEDGESTAPAPVDDESGAAAPEAAPADGESTAPASAAPTEKSETAPAKKKRPSRGKRRAPTPRPERPELRVALEALENRTPLEGRVIGWNHGGFHLALGELSAFCPRSEMEIGEIQEPESYLDQTFDFRVLRLQGKGRRIVVSRAAQLRNDKTRQRNALRKKLQPGTELDGTVASLKEFGAFIDLGGAQGLVHVSEISHRRVEHPSDVLSEGQEVRVKVLKVEQGGRRISLSIRALEPDPWKDLADRFPSGAVVKGTVEKANQIGAFIELAPGLTGLLPARSMSIPRDTTPARAYPPGKEVSVQIIAVDRRRQRISLGLEGSGLEGSSADYKEYQRQSREAAEGDGFNALASAFRRLQGGAD